MPQRSAPRPERDPSRQTAAAADHAASGTLATGRWLLRGKDGRLTAYARSADGLLRWTETRPGGPDWTGPDLFDAPHLTHLTLAQGADGYVHFVALRTLPKEGGGTEVDVVHAVQYQSGRPLMDWRSLGNPHTKMVERAPHLGAPTAAVDAAGTVHVFVRDAVNSVRLRREGKGGKWEGWKDFKVREVLDGITAVATSTGRVEVYGPAENKTLHWAQEKQGGEFQRAGDIPLPPAAGSGTALETGPDRLTFYAADARGKGVLAHRCDDEDMRPLGGVPDQGHTAAVRATIEGHDCTVLAHRGQDGRPVIAAYPTEDEKAGVWWAETGEPCLGSPALALDARGRVVMATIGLDGTLRLARQKAESGLALGAWTRV
ncbi:hypothetical protein OG302_11395 [Streptomyces sp. NBC_01283]|uniref:hypothetical protein n=1 Tax=Streptomyces sp. NBC_01283 TaxID=2903812 RepID=UPI00352BDA27|nr:hypothetical protein OG302_11395 [Streptomyces sp. NBC_01283]